MTSTVGAAAAVEIEPRSPVRIGVFGAFGVGNMGNDESARVAISLIRRHEPDASIGAIARSTVEAERALGVPAVTIFAPTEGGGGGIAARIVRKLRDVRHLMRVVTHFDVVVVPGSGMLQAAPGWLPSGDISWMLALSLACRARGVRLVWFAVGSSHGHRGLSAVCVRVAAACVSYLSFRDRTSAETIGPRAGARAVITPDLVFSRALPPARPSTRGRRTVGVAVMDYDPTGQAGRDRYLAQLARAIVGLLDAGWTVRFLLGDAADRAAAVSVAESVESVRPEWARSEIEGADTMDRLMTQVEGCDVVVSSRFHVLVAAAIMAKPLVAVSHADKDDALLDQLGLADYVLPATGFDAEEVIDRVSAAHADGERISAQLAAQVREFHDRVLADFASAAAGLRAGRSR